MKHTRTREQRRNIRRWLKALRSGTYNQGKGRLRSIKKLDSGAYEYCCLGVLRDVADPTIKSKDGVIPKNKFISLIGPIPKPASFIAFVPNLDPQGLARLNDVDNKTFHQIANLVENAVNKEDPDWKVGL